MHVATLLVANRAAVTEQGLLDIAGAGWEFVNMPSLPTPLSGWLAGLMQFEPDEVGNDFSISMRSTNPQALTMTGVVMNVRANRRLVPFAIPFAAVILAAGEQTIVLEHASGPVGNVSFEARLVSPGPNPAR